MKIYYLKNKDIDLDKWNECIKNSFNGIVYAYSWYLDIVNEEWEALVDENYTRVMPLTIANKYKINYLHQPYFTQQLGVFSTQILNSEIVARFVEAIPTKYRFYELNLNTFNKLENYKYELTKNITYELDLISNYEKTLQNYSTNTKRNLKKATTNKISVLTGIQPNDLINLFINNNENKLIKVTNEHYDTIRKIMSTALRYQIGEILGAYNEKNELCSAAFFITSHHKSIYLFAASSESGKETGANFKLIDTFIQKYSGLHLTLDFEGSNIDGLARYYSSFGAKPCEYYRIKKNLLPWYIKIFKP